MFLSVESDEKDVKIIRIQFRFLVTAAISRSHSKYDQHLEFS